MCSNQNHHAIFNTGQSILDSLTAQHGFRNSGGRFPTATMYVDALEKRIAIFKILPASSRDTRFSVSENRAFNRISLADRREKNMLAIMRDGRCSVASAGFFSSWVGTLFEAYHGLPAIWPKPKRIYPVVGMNLVSYLTLLLHIFHISRVHVTRSNSFFLS